MHRHLATLGIACLVFAGATVAAPVTLRINATVVAYSTDLGLLSFSGAAGDSFYVDYTFDAATGDTNLAPEIGTYVQALTSYTVVMNGVSMTPGVSNAGNFIQVLNDYGSPGDYMDAYYVSSGQMVAGQASYALQVTMEEAYSPTPVASFGSDALPGVPWDVAGFSNRTLDFAVFTTVGGVNRSNALQGAITSITALPSNPPPPGGPGGNPVSAPATTGLLALGLGALGVQRRRSRPPVTAA